MNLSGGLSGHPLFCYFIFFNLLFISFLFIYFGSCVNLSVVCFFRFCRKAGQGRQLENNYKLILSKLFAVYVRPYFLTPFLSESRPRVVNYRTTTNFFSEPFAVYVRPCLLSHFPLPYPSSSYIQVLCERVSFVPLVSLSVSGSGTDPISLLILVFFFLVGATLECRSQAGRERTVPSGNLEGAVSGGVNGKNGG